MKYLIMVLLLVFASSISQAKGSMEERKAKALTRIDKKISLMNEHKSCVASASKKDDIKTCRTTHKSKMKAFRAEHKEKHKDK